MHRRRLGPRTPRAPGAGARAGASARRGGGTTTPRAEACRDRYCIVDIIPICYYHYCITTISININITIAITITIVMMIVIMIVIIIIITTTTTTTTMIRSGVCYARADVRAQRTRACAFARLRVRVRVCACGMCAYTFMGVRVCIQASVQHGLRMRYVSCKMCVSCTTRTLRGILFSLIVMIAIIWLLI